MEYYGERQKRYQTALIFSGKVSGVFFITMNWLTECGSVCCERYKPSWNINIPIWRSPANVRKKRKEIYLSLSLLHTFAKYICWLL